MLSVLRIRSVSLGLVTLVTLPLISAAGGARRGREVEAAAQASEAMGELLSGHRRVVTGTYREPTGPGFELLVTQGAASEFLLLGESHQTAETPLLFQALAEALRDAGYGAIAVEIGPLSARDLVARLRGGGVDAQVESATRYPFTLPFFELRGEAELLAAALDSGYEVWGLDQEFIGSGRYWLDRLAVLAPDDVARQAVATWQERELAAVQHYLQTESTAQAMLNTATPEDFAQLRAAFGGAGAVAAAESMSAAGAGEEDEAPAIIDALAASARIYQLWQSANYENNRQRVDYMRGNLATHLKAWERDGATPRVLMKFGSYHMGRGRSPANQFDLGNMALQLAAYRGGSSLHVFATALGMRAADGSFSSWIPDEPLWHLLSERVDPEQPWTVFDLRALRPYFHEAGNREGNESSAEMVWNYDLVAVAPEFHPAQPLTAEQ